MAHAVSVRSITSRGTLMITSNRGLRVIAATILVAGLAWPAADAQARGAWRPAITLFKGKRPSHPTALFGAPARPAVAFAARVGTSRRPHASLLLGRGTTSGEFPAVAPVADLGLIPPAADPGRDYPEWATTPAGQDATGTSVLVFEQRAAGHPQRIGTIVTTAAGASALRQTLSDARREAASPAVAVNASGDAVAGWCQRDAAGGWTIEVATRRAGARFERAQAVAAATPDRVCPTVAIGAGGQAVAVWASGGTVQAATGRAGRAFGPAQQLAAVPGTQVVPAVAMNKTGETIATWLVGSGLTTDGEGDWHIFTAHRPARGAFEAAQEVPESAYYGWTYDPVRIAIADDGASVLAYARITEGPSTVYAAARPAGGQFGPARALTTPSVQAQSPALAVGANGTAVLAWVEYRGQLENARVVASVRPHRGDFGPAVNVSGRPRAVARPSVAVSPKGAALVAWDHCTPGNRLYPGGAIQAAVSRGPVA
jgi:hypothetical protein